MGKVNEVWDHNSKDYLLSKLDILDEDEQNSS
jgi:hypothetical protein